MPPMCLALFALLALVPWLRFRQRTPCVWRETQCVVRCQATPSTAGYPGPHLPWPLVSRSASGSDTLAGASLHSAPIGGLCAAHALPGVVRGRQPGMPPGQVRRTPRQGPMPLMGSGIPITLLALPARVGLRGIRLRSASRRATQGRASLRSQPTQGEVFGAGAAPGVAAGIVPGVVPGAAPSVARSVLPGALPGVVPGVTPGVAREAQLTPPRPETCVSGPRARFPRRAFISHSAARTSCRPTLAQSCLARM